MQLHTTPPSESGDTDEEDNHLDLHILVLQPGSAIEENDVIMEAANTTGANKENLDPSQSSRTNQGLTETNTTDDSLDPLALISQESVPHIHVEGQAEIGMYYTNQLPGTSDYASLRSSDAALLDGPNISELSTPLPKIPKIEENPFSPCLLDLEMYPALPSPPESSEPQPHVSLPHGRINLNGIYYDPVPPPHNIVVATSSIPTEPMVRQEQSVSATPAAPADEPKASTSAASTIQPEAPTSATPAVQPEASTSAASATTSQDSPTSKKEPRVGLEFVMPEEPPFQKVERKSRKKSRSLSRNRSKSRSQFRANAANRKLSASQQPTTLEETPKACGRGRKRPEMTNAPIIVPTSYSHLLHIPEPKGGLTVTFSKEEQLRKVETTVQHLEQLSAEASIPMEVVSKPSEATMIRAEAQPDQEDSDVDLETGNIFVPTRPISDTEVLVYKTDADIEDCKAFMSIITFRESSIWDREKIAIAPDLFYESYFKDFQYLTNLRQKRYYSHTVL